MIEIRIRADEPAQLDDLFPSGFTSDGIVEVYCGDVIVTVDYCEPVDTDDEPGPLIGDDELKRFGHDNPEPSPVPWVRRDNSRPYDIEPSTPKPPPPAATGRTDAELDSSILDVLHESPATAHDIAYVLDEDDDTILVRLRILRDGQRVESAGVKGWKIRRRDFDQDAARRRAAEAL